MLIFIRILRKVVIKIQVLFSNQYRVARIYRKYYEVKIGENVRFTGEPSWGSEPFLITIGNNVTITQNVTFHTHDGGVGLFRDEYPGINIIGEIKIGNNVFVGSNCVFLPNVIVGDNVVIGAGSIISKNIPSNCVAVGSPAKPIKTISEYKAKCLSNAIFIPASSSKKRKNYILQQLHSNSNFE